MSEHSAEHQLVCQQSARGGLGLPSQTEAGVVGRRMKGEVADEPGQPVVVETGLDLAVHGGTLIGRGGNVQLGQAPADQAVAADGPCGIGSLDLRDVRRLIDPFQVDVECLAHPPVAAQARCQAVEQPAAEFGRGEDRVEFRGQRLVLFQVQLQAFAEGIAEQLPCAVRRRGLQGAAELIDGLGITTLAEQDLAPFGQQGGIVRPGANWAASSASRVGKRSKRLMASVVCEMTTPWWFTRLPGTWPSAARLRERIFPEPRSIAATSAVLKGK